MSAEQGRNPVDAQGRAGDIQARQTDDGSFELVVEANAASASATGAAADSRPVADALRAPSASRFGKSRMMLVLAGALIALGVLAYGFSRHEKTTSDSTSGDAASDDGFRPYQEGPVHTRATPATSAQSNRVQPLPPAEGDERTLTPPPSQDEDWDPKADSEVIVIDDGIDDQHEVENHADELPSDDMPADEPPVDDHRAYPVPKTDLKGFRKFQQPLMEAHPTPNLQRIPVKRLENMRQALSRDQLDDQSNDPPNGLNEQQINDFEAPPQDDALQDEDREDSASPDEPGAEYDDPDDGFNGQGQGY